MNEMDVLKRKYCDFSGEFVENSDGLAICFGVNLNRVHYDLLYVLKYLDKSDSIYLVDDDLQGFFEELSFLCSKYVSFNKKKLSNVILEKCLNDDLKNGKYEIKHKRIYDALKKQDLIYEDDNKQIELDDKDLVDLFISDNEYREMISKCIVFDKRGYEKSNEYRNVVFIYEKLCQFLSFEIKNNHASKDKLKELLHIFESEVGFKIYHPKECFLSGDCLDEYVDDYTESYPLNKVLDDGLMSDLSRLLYSRCIISLDDVFSFVDDDILDLYFYDNDFYDNKADYLKNDFVKKFIVICHQICKKDDESRYTDDEILSYLIDKNIKFQHKYLQVIEDDCRFNSDNVDSYSDNCDMVIYREDDSYDDCDSATIKIRRRFK